MIVTYNFKHNKLIHVLEMIVDAAYTKASSIIDGRTGGQNVSVR